MKAVIVRDFRPFDQAEYGDLDDPKPGRGDVIVDIDAAETNFADILYIEGKYQRKPPLPFSPGLAGAGRVSELGENVTDLKVGQKVLVLPHYGAYAQKVCAPAQFCFPVPAAMPSAVAASFGLVYQTAYFALTDRGQMRAGDAVLVLGATGGIGMAAVQLAKAMGARVVIAATRGAEGAALARKFGADVSVDVNMENLRDGLREAVARVTDGQGADIVIDPVGGSVSEAALRTLAWRGRLVVVGFASGEVPKFAGNYLLVKNIAVSGIQWTDYRARLPEQVRAAQEKMFELWSEGKLTPVITRTLPLSRFAEALADLQNAKARGKIILTTNEDRVADVA